MLYNQQKSALYEAVFVKKDWNKVKELIDEGKVSIEHVLEILRKKASNAVQISSEEAKEVYRLMFRYIKNENSKEYNGIFECLVNQLSLNLYRDEDYIRYARERLESVKNENNESEVKYYEKEIETRYEVLKTWLDLAREAGIDDIYTL